LKVKTAKMRAKMAANRKSHQLTVKAKQDKFKAQ